MAVIPALKETQQKVNKFKYLLGNLARLCHKIKVLLSSKDLHSIPRIRRRKGRKKKRGEGRGENEKEKLKYYQ